MSAIYAEDQSWYEIDGIKIRYGNLRNTTDIFLQGHSPRISEGPESSFINKNDKFSHLKPTPIFPIAIVLPETLMSSWSFRGAVFEYQNETEVKDLTPRPDDDSISEDTTHWRQKPSVRTLLYNNFFTASDKSFADANPNWAVSADVSGSSYFLGYNFGVFFPVGEYNRFLKTGIGAVVYYTDISIKLNFCSQYKITVTNESGRESDAECVGKTEIDSSSESRLGATLNTHFTLWERITKNSIWKILSWTQANYIHELKLKNHNNLKYRKSSGTEVWISYTYRF